MIQWYHWWRFRGRWRATFRRSRNASRWVAKVDERGKWQVHEQRVERLMRTQRFWTAAQLAAFQLTVTVAAAIGVYHVCKSDAVVGAIVALVVAGCLVVSLLPAWSYYMEDGE